MSAPDKDEASWTESQRQVVEEYLLKEKVDHLGVSVEPAFTVYPYVAIWAVQSKAPGNVGWWAVSGDLFTNYISRKEAETPREALAIFASQWLELSKAIQNVPEVARLAQCRAQILLAWADDDVMWNPDTPAVAVVKRLAYTRMLSETPTIRETDILQDDYLIKKPATSKNLAYEVAAALDEHIEFHEGQDVLKRTISPATAGQRAVYSVIWYVDEVNNGGHRQFFWNSTGILTDEVLKGLDLLQAPEHLSVLKSAIALFPDGDPAKGRELRTAQVDKISKKILDEIDDRFYGLSEKEDLYRICDEYILNHPDEFFTP